MTPLIVLIIVLVPLSLFATVATFGTREDGGRERACLENTGFVVLFAFIEYFAPGFFQAMGSVFLVAFLAVRFPSFLRGWNYLFVAHPAAPIVNPALRGKSVDVEGLANVLVEGAQDSGDEATYHYQHQAEKARALAEKLNADSAIAEARAERERRRAELAEAERFLKETRRRSEGNR